MSKLDDTNTWVPLRWLLAGLGSTVLFTLTAAKYAYDIRRDLDEVKKHLHENAWTRAEMRQWTYDFRELNPTSKVPKIIEPVARSNDNEDNH